MIDVRLLLSETWHYANMSVQYTVNFNVFLNENFQFKFWDFFLIFLKTKIVGTR